MDPVTHGFLHLDGVRRHVAVVLPVVDPGLGTVPDGGAARVHGDVATADDDDFAAQVEGRRVLQERKRLEPLPFAGDVQQGRFLGAGAQQDRVIAGCHAGQFDVPANLDAALELDPGSEEQALVGVDIFLVQAETGDTVAENAADAGVRVGDAYLGTQAVQPDGGDDAHGTGPDEGDALAGEEVRLPFERDAEQVGVGNLLLDLVPADRDFLDVQDTVSKAELPPVAHAGGDGGQGIVVEKDFARFVQLVFPVKLHALGNGRMDRTSLQGAFGLLAQEAAERFVVFHKKEDAVVV